MSSVAVFDVDGVLVDTHDIVRKAYAEVGIDLPDHLWGAAWQSWLPERCGGDPGKAQDVHEQKTRIHLDLLNSSAVRTLAGAHAADFFLSRRWTVKFITSGTGEVARRTLDSVRPGWSDLLAGTGLDSPGKRRALNDIRAGGGVYTDDNCELGVKITQDLPWKLVHFRGQTLIELIKEIAGSWTR